MEESKRKSEEKPAKPNGSSNAEEISLIELYIAQGIKLLEEMATYGDREAAGLLEIIDCQTWEAAAEFAEPLSAAKVLSWT